MKLFIKFHINLYSIVTYALNNIYHIKQIHVINNVHGDLLKVQQFINKMANKNNNYISMIAMDYCMIPFLYRTCTVTYKFENNTRYYNLTSLFIFSDILNIKSLTIKV